MAERRYTEEEVAEIFQRATEAQHGDVRRLPSGDGTTLEALQEIGREVGIAPELIARAAHSLDRGGQPIKRRFLGLPIGVGRTVELERRLSDAEWERLVIDLRETFDARGVLRQDGAFRQWTNGNLQALLEPTETGHRLRLRTIKGSAYALMMSGLGMLGIAGLALVKALVSGFGVAELSSVAVLVALAGGLFGVGALQLPTWSRTREHQMEEIAARLTSSVRPPDE
jgi:hypothetical protein